MQTMARGEFFSQMKISSILRRFSISKLTEFMPRHLEKLMTRLQWSRETIILLQSFFCWGVSYDATTKLHFCKKGVNTSAKVYEDTVLEPVVKLFNNTLFSNEHWSFKQDLASAHKALSTKVWLRGIFPTPLLRVILGLLALQQLWPQPNGIQESAVLEGMICKERSTISKVWSVTYWQQWRIFQRRHCVIQQIGGHRDLGTVWRPKMAILKNDWYSMFVTLVGNPLKKLNEISGATAPENQDRLKRLLPDG